MDTTRKTMHFTEMQHLIAIAEEHRQTLNGKAWTTEGKVNEYNGWIVHHQYWRKGYVRLRNPSNGEIRLVPEIYILEVNGYSIYL